MYWKNSGKVDRIIFNFLYTTVIYTNRHKHCVNICEVIQFIRITLLYTNLLNGRHNVFYSEVVQLLYLLFVCPHMY